MSYYETSKAIQSALYEIEENQKAIENLSSSVAKTLVGRLRSLSTYGDTNTLIALKKELADFNMTTRQWKSK